MRARIESLERRVERIAPTRTENLPVRGSVVAVEHLSEDPLREAWELVQSEVAGSEERERERSDAEWNAWMRLSDDEAIRRGLPGDPCA